MKSLEPKSSQRERVRILGSKTLSYDHGNKAIMVRLQRPTYCRDEYITTRTDEEFQIYL